MEHTEKITHLKEEIAKLEKEMNHDHFSGLVDKTRSEKQFSRLKKLKRELKELEESR